MRLAIMQPYLFPYIGYFQLVNAVDKFVAYDDVTFIKQGWINRNNILLNGKAFMFTVPLVSASSNTLIYDTRISEKSDWRSKFLKTVVQAYKKAPLFEPTYALLESIINQQTEYISALATHSLKKISTYLGIPTEIQDSSREYGNNEFAAQDRIIDICKREKADHYVNPSGGKELYDTQVFREHGIQLNFINTPKMQYTQFSGEFVPWLSIIDVLMFNNPEAAKELVDSYELA
jgi:hypothetical protein